MRQQALFAHFELHCCCDDRARVCTGVMDGHGDTVDNTFISYFSGHVVQIGPAM